jgi:hypothetical protein
MRWWKEEGEREVGMMDLVRGSGLRFLSERTVRMRLEELEMHGLMERGSGGTGAGFGGLKKGKEERWRMTGWVAEDWWKFQ